MNKSIICRLLSTAVIIWAVTLSVHSKDSEPENHLGWTFSELQTKFPSLFKIQEDGNTVVCALGESGDEGVSWYYILTNNIVFTEMWNVRSKDSHARDFFDQMSELLSLAYPQNLVERKENEIHFKFSTFTLDYTYKIEGNGIRTTLGVYKMIFDH